MARLYLAGPMSGYPQSNIPAFVRAARFLRECGHDVVSPAELDRPDVTEAVFNGEGQDLGPRRGTVAGYTWADFLTRDIKVVVDEGIEEIRVLPGWARSKGARLETFVAYLAGLRIYTIYGKQVSLARLAVAWVFGR